jgi:hypothetical protein
MIDTGNKTIWVGTPIHLARISIRHRFDNLLHNLHNVLINEKKGKKKYYLMPSTIRNQVVFIIFLI